jgi:hypothetical protein
MSELHIGPLEEGAKVAITYHDNVTSVPLDGPCDLITIEVPVGEGLTVATAIQRFLRVEITPFARGEGHNWRLPHA